MHSFITIYQFGQETAKAVLLLVSGDAVETVGIGR
jgi:hypothetical protein